MAKDHLAENQQLRGQLKAFVEEARNNEEKMRRFNDQELWLISTTSLAELVHLILYQTRKAFGLDVITLTLVDPEYEFTRILEGSGVQVDQVPELIIEPDPLNLDYLYNGSYVPKLGRYRSSHHSMLFPKGAVQPECIAMLPLVRQRKLIGSLNLGSFDSSRYGRGTGTEFLNRLAVVVAICLENTLNQERLKLVGLTDPLTRVNNRRFFDQRLGEEVSASTRYEQPLVCMFLDVDHFKQVNDTLGHQAGDLVLCQLAELMGAQLRRNDILCRYGGEEFVSLLPNTSLHDACEIAERTRRLVAERAFKIDNGETTQVTISIGVAALSNSGVTAIESVGHQLVNSADEAVYRAKSSGRNRVVVADTLDSEQLEQLA
ncbi:hypothetical protein BOW53_10355 [Solemya pervernicosa gill symbiont]|uniref:diguanylate cyclase n=2 Tax=Gammaproteobacteria incertae sedis TaxID=118884 RepID=A0A1T2L3U3_9GAMM|nr:sensor domain-containing diguanylate cyclase [Candidatus Reidiella endopervernicosa]OOZ39767.1 hypothetical protein BOW53_10355 [Solemya pervernicosa gill symbiont]QKQ27925.1 sensor domain-containing diguanylate cyclase [Candidatus Reidiella endopervernicosa]